MDLKGPKYLEAPPAFHSQQEARLEGTTMFYRTGTENPFLDAFQDPLCKINLKETSEFVKSFPTCSSNGAESNSLLDVTSAQRRREFGLSSLSRRTVEAPPTPGRPIFSFSVGNLPRKGFPSKWEDAEKWLVSGHDSPAHQHHHHHYYGLRPPPLEYCSKMMPKPCNHPDDEVFPATNSRVTDEKVTKFISGFHSAAAGFNEGSASAADLLLKDKFTNEADGHFPTFKCSEPTKQGFFFGNAAEEKPIVKDAAAANESVVVMNEVKHRDIGTEMTPLGSSTTSRCPTPFKSTSPARHNTPANRSGPLVLPDSNTTTIDIAQIQECHLAKLQFGMQFDSVTSNWSSREEEEEEISKSLRHFELNNNNAEYKKKSISESRTCAWEEEEKTKCCLRYQREEAKIQAWVNLQRAKAEAQSRKLEVKIEKMRSNLEDKLMKRMGIVHRKAEEWRTASRIQHLEQIQKANSNNNEHGHKHKILTNSSQTTSSYSTSSCGCFPCTTTTTSY